MRNQKSGRGMARIRSFEPSGQDGLQTFRFLISDFSRFQEFLLELGVLLGDLLRHLPPLRFQAPGQGLVLHRQDLGGQHSSIFRAVQCYRSHRDAAGHLDCGQQGIQSIQDFKLPIFHFLQRFCGIYPYLDLTDVRPAAADAALAEIFQVPMGTPLLNMEEVDYDIDGRPVFCSSEYFVDGIFRHTVMRKKL